MKWIWAVVGLAALALVGCGGKRVEAQPQSEVVAQPEAVEVTVEVTRIVEVVVTATPTPTEITAQVPPAYQTLAAKLTVAATEESEETQADQVSHQDGPAGAGATATPTTSPTATSTPLPIIPHVEQGVNLRQGPGTNYPIAGGLTADDTVEVLARNEAGDWYQVQTTQGTAWMAAWLLVDGPAATDVPVATTIPDPPPPTSTPTAAPVVATGAPSSADKPDLTPELNVTHQCGYFEYKVYDLKRVKSVWFYDEEYIAQGEFLLVFVEVKNVSSGTSYLGEFAPRLGVLEPLTQKVELMTGDFKASQYAGWMYQSGGFYEDINPGEVLGLVEAYPLPDNWEFGLVFVPAKCPVNEENFINLGAWSKVPRGHDK